MPSKRCHFVKTCKPENEYTLLIKHDGHVYVLHFPLTQNGKDRAAEQLARWAVDPELNLDIETGEKLVEIIATI